MGFRFQRRIRLSRDLFLNASGSGLSLSRRMSWGTLSTRGLSVRTGIPGLSYRVQWGRGASGSVVGLLVVAAYALVAACVVG